MNRGRTEAFLQWIEQEITRLAPGTALPTENEFAAQWRLSVRSIRAVLNGLKKKGLLLRIPGKGTFVPQDFSPGPLLPRLQPTSSAQTLADCLRTLIGKGIYPPGNPMPPPKSISHTYGVAVPTVRSALTILCRNGSIHRIGRLYWPGREPSERSSRKSATVYVLHPDNEGLSEALRRYHLYPAFFSLEKELYRHGYTLRFLRGGNLRELLHRVRFQDDKDSLVIFSWRKNQFFPGIAERLSELFPPQKNLRKKVLIISPLKELISKQFSQVCTGHLGTRLAQRVAGFVLEHRISSLAIAVDIDQPMQWSLAGYFKIYVETKNLSPRTQIVFYVKSRNSGHLQNAMNTNAQAIAALSAKYDNWHSGKHDPGLFRMTDDILDCVAEANVRQLTVFAQEEPALAAKTWLENHRRTVPSTSILSLQNGADCLEHGITVCEYDPEKTGQMWAHALIGTIPVQRTRKGFIQSQVHLIERSPAPDPRNSPPGRRIRYGDHDD